MTILDWSVLVFTIGFISIYGVWKARGGDAESHLRDGTQRWPTIGLGIMATQASAITFLSTPGQAYDDGMRFVQFYFGLPLAMVVISAVFVPIFYRLKVYTAYEYLEHRFDQRVRYLGAVLFLVQRGLAAGITIYAPSIILASIMGWSMDWVIVAIGLVVIGYTVTGGAKAIAQTQKQQMIVMMGGMAIAAAIVIWRLPRDVSLPAAVGLAGALDRMNVVSFDLDPGSRYNFWSGITGGFFLALSYFGTDQSQVQRYLSGRSAAESRLGLLFNGMFKVPMQFFILFIGVLVFVFHLFIQPPVFFNQSALERARATGHGPALQAIEARYDTAFATQRDAAQGYVDSRGDGALEAAARETLRKAAADVREIRGEAKKLVAEALPGTETKDADYVFLGFVLRYLPSGLVGLLIAVILCAAMSSTASELAALGSTSTIDLWERVRGAPTDPGRRLLVSKIFTAVWGLVAIGFATFASLVDNLIEAVNILGSIFYGTVLGLFVVGFFLRRVSATPVLIGAVVAQSIVATLYFASDLGFLWFNVIGCAVVVVVSLVLEAFRTGARRQRV